MIMKSDEELFDEYNEINNLSIELQNQAEEKRKMASRFREKNYDAIHRHEMKLWQEKQDKQKSKRIDQEEQDSKVFKYLQSGMWVMVKTRSGLKWKQITHKQPAQSKYHGSYVYCAEPSNPKTISYDRKDDTYSALDLDVKDVYRSDAYVVASVRHVLVPTENGRYVKKSLRGEIIKENT